LANQHQSVDQYRKAAISSATPLQLVIMLYDGALRFMQAAKIAVDSGDRFTQNEKLLKAQRIIVELSSCLDHEKGAEIAKNLGSLYDFVYNRLIEANIQDRSDYIEQAMKVISDLRESWVTVEGQSRNGAAPQSGATQPTDHAA
jgi:flagellar secretion chaperone FliS